MVTISYSGVGFDSTCSLRLQKPLQVTTSLSTGEGPVSCVLLSEEGFQVMNPFGLWSRSCGVGSVMIGIGYGC